MPNRLAGETSPYLLQHANNPVDWYPWGEEAIRRAKETGRPIFLSIGYSACHWCHVMEQESFENPRIAAVMNEKFINIKVDREERPDLDQVYMSAVQALAGRGGWPMSVFLTPDLQPFFGGTYWPPEPRLGMAGFEQVLNAVADAWRDRREEIVKQAGQLTAYLRTLAASGGAAGDLDPATLDNAAAALERTFDRRWGGFGGAPKFPHAIDVRLLMRIWNRQRRGALLQVATLTLDRMAAGGIYDQLGGGFHRYSVDERWLVPHFEKMLYDNALLAPAYLEAFQITGNTDYARVAAETLDFVLRDMTDSAGAFYSTLDADSEGVEGKYYVWRLDEIQELLGPEKAGTFASVYGVTEEGNFEGASILNLSRGIEHSAQSLKRDPHELRTELAQSRAKLLAERAKRVPPALDDKVLVSWNGMMIDALALGSSVLGERRYLASAQRAADFLLAQMIRPDGSLLHTYRKGTARLDAYLDDYVCLAGGLVTLYEAAFEERYIDAAVALVDRMLKDFRDSERGGFYFTANNHETLIARQKDWHDSSVPSGNAMAAMVLLRLGKLCGRNDYLDAALTTMRSCGKLLAGSPLSCGQMLIAYDFYRGPTYELVLVDRQRAPAGEEVLKDLGRRFIPNRVLAARFGSPGDPQDHPQSPHLEPLFAGKQPGMAGPSLLVCEGFACRAPAVGPEAIDQELDRLTAPSANGTKSPAP